MIIKNAKNKASYYPHFFIHGITYASLAPWIPDLKEKFNLSNYMIGIMISAIPAGSITFGLFSKS